MFSTSVPSDEQQLNETEMPPAWKNSSEATITKAVAEAAITEAVFNLTSLHTVLTFEEQSEDQHSTGGLKH